MKFLLAAVFAGVCFSSCVPLTPQGRIDRHPEKFSRLTSKQKELVTQGQIAPGMSPDAVWLAWGAPERNFEGAKEGKRTARWDYAASEAVYTTGIYGGYGRYGRYGHGRYYGSGFSLGPEIAYIPYRVASVWFVNERVEAWEHAR